MNKEQHIVVIGGGLGGLLCGYMLGRGGYKVTVLEQHHTIGGCLQSFVRGGVKFDTGMHYVGSMGRGESLYNFFDYLGLVDKFRFEKLDEDGFDIIHIKGKEYRYGSGFDNFVDLLSLHFPSERANLVRYVDTIREIASGSIFYSGDSSGDLMDNPYLSLSISDMLDGITDDEELKSVLVGNSFLYAGQRGVTPAYLGALINTSYIQGAYRVVGGSDAIARILCDGIEGFGGQVVTGAQVCGIDCCDKLVVGVELADGRRFEGDSFISNIHPFQTVNMMDIGLFRRTYINRISTTPVTPSAFTVYIIFKPNVVPYQRYNYYHHSCDVWDSVDCGGENFGNSYLYMHQCEDDCQLYARSAILTAFMDYDDVKGWESVKNRKLDSSYRAFVDFCAKKLLAKLESSHPGVGEHIDSYYSSTPLTYVDYTSTPRGSVYGTALDVNSSLGGVITHLSRVRNLHFVGQNTYAHGMLGVVIGSIITCGEFLGLANIIDGVHKR